MLYTVNVEWSKRVVAKIFIFQLVNFDYFPLTNDYSLVSFNDSISHFQLTIRKSQI